MSKSKEKLVTVQLQNLFHGTKVNVRVPEWTIGQAEAYQWLEQNRPRVAKRVDKTLCGMKDCCC